MPDLKVEVRATVYLRMPEEFAKRVTMEDVVAMAANAICSGDFGRGVQIVCDGVAQWESEEAYQKSLEEGDCRGAIMADAEVEMDEMEYQESDEEFEKLEE